MTSICNLVAFVKSYHYCHCERNVVKRGNLGVYWGMAVVE